MQFTMSLVSPDFSIEAEGQTLLPNSRSYFCSGLAGQPSCKETGKGQCTEHISHLPLECSYLPLYNQHFESFLQVLMLLTVQDPCLLFAWS